MEYFGTALDPTGSTNRRLTTGLGVLNANGFIPSRVDIAGAWVRLVLHLCVLGFPLDFTLNLSSEFELAGRGFAYLTSDNFTYIPKALA